MTFWKPEPVPGAPDRYRLPITDSCCVGPDGSQYLMGGVAMAAVISALERNIGKPLLWMTIQFLSPGGAGETLDIRLQIGDRTRRTIQAGAETHAGGRLLHRVVAAFGGRGSWPDTSFMNMPVSEPPGSGTPWHPGDPSERSDLLGQFEVRSAWQDAESGLEHSWVRPVHDTTPSAATLALASDFILGAHPVTQACTSLDNTFRLFALPETSWVLHVTEMAGFVNGAAHARQTMFDANGRLLAISSQTGLIPYPTE